MMKETPARTLLALFFLLCLASVPLRAQSTQGSKTQTKNEAFVQTSKESATEDYEAHVSIVQKPIHTTIIQSHVDEVALSVSVTSAADNDYGRPIIGLQADNFQIFDEKVSQKITSFSMEDTPISIVVVLDTSGSLGDKLIASLQAVKYFIEEANPEDEWTIIALSRCDTLGTKTVCGDAPYILAGPTSRSETLYGDLSSIKKAVGKTALYDAVYLGLNILKDKATLPRKDLVIISDGGDNHSRYTERDVKNFLRETDAQVFSVGIFEPTLNFKNLTQEEQEGPRVLDELAHMTGGTMFAITGDIGPYLSDKQFAGELEEVVRRVNLLMRNEYFITYRPSNLVRDGKWRRVKVRVSPPKGTPLIKVNVRSGYYAPTQ